MKKTFVACVFLSQTLTLAVEHPPPSCRRTRQQQQTARIGQPAATPTRDAKRGHEWRAASYRGLTLGKSKTADMLRVFGKPNASEIFDEGVPTPEVWYFYQGVGEFPGELIVDVDKGSGVIRRLILHPESLSKEEAVRHFGDDYLVTRYDFDQCLRAGDSAPLYESPQGSVVRIEYRDRGIAISLNYKDDVNFIGYVSDPVGASESRCKK